MPKMKEEGYQRRSNWWTKSRQRMEKEDKGAFQKVVQSEKGKGPVEGKEASQPVSLLSMKIELEGLLIKTVKSSDANKKSSGDGQGQSREGGTSTQTYRTQDGCKSKGNPPAEAKRSGNDGLKKPSGAGQGQNQPRKGSGDGDGQVQPRREGVKLKTTGGSEEETKKPTEEAKRSQSQKRKQKQKIWIENRNKCQDKFKERKPTEQAKSHGSDEQTKPSGNGDDPLQSQPRKECFTQKSVRNPRSKDQDKEKNPTEEAKKHSGDCQDQSQPRKESVKTGKSESCKSQRQEKPTEEAKRSGHGQGHARIESVKQKTEGAAEVWNQDNDNDKGKSTDKSKSRFAKKKNSAIGQDISQEECVKQKPKAWSERAVRCKGEEKDKKPTAVTTSSDATKQSGNVQKENAKRNPGSLACFREKDNEKNQTEEIKKSDAKKRRKRGRGHPQLWKEGITQKPTENEAGCKDKDIEKPRAEDFHTKPSPSHHTPVTSPPEEDKGGQNPELEAFNEERKATSTKVSVRLLPPYLTQKEFLHKVKKYVPTYNYFYLRNGELTGPTPYPYSTVWINFTSTQDALDFMEKVKHEEFYDVKRDRVYQPCPDFALFQRVPSKPKVNKRRGTLSRLPEFKEFMRRWESEEGLGLKKYEGPKIEEMVEAVEAKHEALKGLKAPLVEYIMDQGFSWG